MCHALINTSKEGELHLKKIIIVSSFVLLSQWEDEKLYKSSVLTKLIDKTEHEMALIVNHNVWNFHLSLVVIRLYSNNLYWWSVKETPYPVGGLLRSFLLAIFSFLFLACWEKKSSKEKVPKIYFSTNNEKNRIKLSQVNQIFSQSNI